jgi:hypothetical protein
MAEQIALHKMSQLNLTRCLSDSLHAYERDLKRILAASPIAPFEDTSSLALPLSDSGKVFQDLACSVERIIDHDTSPADLLIALNNCRLPAAYKDMLAVLTAEGLRNRGATSAYMEAINVCASPLHRQLWQRWFARYPVKSTVQT